MISVQLPSCKALYTKFVVYIICISKQQCHLRSIASLKNFAKLAPNLHQWNLGGVVNCLMLMGYLFQKKSKRGGLRIYFSEKKNPRIFTLVTLSLEILQNCVTSLGNFKVINQYPRVFCKHTLKFHFYVNEPLEFPHALFSYPLKFHVLSSTTLIRFFLEKPNSHFLTNS